MWMFSTLHHARRRAYAVLDGPKRYFLATCRPGQRHLGFLSCHMERLHDLSCAHACAWCPLFASRRRPMLSRDPNACNHPPSPYGLLLTACSWIMRSYFVGRSTAVDEPVSWTRCDVFAVSQDVVRPQGRQQRLIRESCSHTVAAESGTEDSVILTPVGCQRCDQHATAKT
ncbi:uncharacterized protein EI97DRAFT_50381 [Westerdykella ornata]|uniref:Uncharacterized protein n=1 Tax=Westerdykella ornata TaxID=318751 RepID=A0A6A6JKB4_WESOR|nr:uncharacterized protein EI97DRAFT_50381 [Westerdykella ornata]KAF2276136.1 hypothetical protein EI97DRAFT_50381 [Westerdykella ornata]